MRLLVVAPFVVVLALLGVRAAINLTFDFKYSSFVWEGLPTEDVLGVTYEWPGVYCAELLQPPSMDDQNWAVTGDG